MKIQDEKNNNLNSSNQKDSIKNINNNNISDKMTENNCNIPNNGDAISKLNHRALNKKDNNNELSSISESKEQNSPLFTRKNFYSDEKEYNGLEGLMESPDFSFNLNNSSNSSKSSNSSFNRSSPKVGLIKDFESLTTKDKSQGSPISRLRKGSLPLPSLYSAKDLQKKSEEMGLTKKELALQRRNARHFWGTMMIPGLDILKSDLVRVKLESDSRLLLFISDIKRSLNASNEEKDKILLRELLEVATNFLSTDTNQIECGKIKEFLSIESEKGEKNNIINIRSLMNIGTPPPSPPTHQVNQLHESPPVSTTTPGSPIPTISAPYSPNSISFNKGHFRTLSYSPKIKSPFGAPPILNDLNDKDISETQNNNNYQNNNNFLLKPNNYQKQKDQFKSSPLSSIPNDQFQPPLISRRITNILKKNDRGTINKSPRSLPIEDIIPSANQDKLLPRVISDSNFLEDDQELTSSEEETENVSSDENRQSLIPSLKPSPPKDKRLDYLITNELSKRQPLVRSKSFSPNKAIEVKKDKVKKLARSFSEIPTIKIDYSPNQQMVICRICEEKIESSLLEEHSKICAMTNQEDMKAMNIDDQLRAIAKILLTRSTNLPQDKRKQLSEIREIAQRAVEMLIKDSTKLITDLKDKIKKFDLSEENKTLAIKIESLITEKTNSLKKAEEVINSSPRIFRTTSPRLMKSKELDIWDLNITSGRSRSDSDPCHQTVSSLEYRPKGIPTIDDFTILKPITKGGFGKVFLAKKKKTGDIYAIKRLKKIDMVKKNQIDHVKVERNILAYTSNPFVVKMYYSFQSRDYFYLVMEYVHGGDCFSLLQNLGALEEDMAKMIIAETVLALEYLHGLGIIHRDLKPDNLLIDKNGHIKLTDFGLSKIGLLDRQSVVPPNFFSPNLGAQLQPPKPKNKRLLPLLATKNMESAFSSPTIAKANLLGSDAPESPLFIPQASNPKQPIPISTNNLQPLNNMVKPKARKLSCVGTPDYLAPEILLGIGHGKEVDWFSVGVMLFEFLTGLPPFSADTVEMTFQNILQRNIKWPSDISPEAKDIIDKLLALNAQSRLGYSGVEEIKAHPFFKGVDWDTIRTQKAYFIPVLEDLQDTSYFDARKQFYDLRISDDTEANTPYVVGESDTSKLFDDFLYVNFQSLSELNQNCLAETKPYVISRRRNSFVEFFLNSFEINI
ncbi:protein serine/threonine kinase [Heterostelium album PN500]|uniref:non-specific serine/threonine protein kinase n=1 Tax=Heterostelium pallidum (strain ATCC 26659 / Pp 5 / PN500) TaxID=670386 RepID=D3BCH4_HETP5|nr:protein serine/threonine kinase [Heterostelium album PN500]EFA80964.1 protein serine/threonine kinase [Heterostelium album PN500]|eukprot:XP_020433082.1 protein serine/threonine kinase [Heterostelium album PN500]